MTSFKKTENFVSGQMSQDDLQFCNKLVEKFKIYNLAQDDIIDFVDTIFPIIGNGGVFTLEYIKYQLPSDKKHFSCLLDDEEILDWIMQILEAFGYKVSEKTVH